MHVFTYGSLMFEPVWQRVVQGDYASRPAWLHGYVRKCVKSEAYPVVFKGVSAFPVDGMLYLNVHRQDVDLLDKFEGEFYVREPVSVKLADGSETMAMTYILKETYRHIATDQHWDIEKFALTGIHQFLQQYRGFLNTRA